MINALLAVPNKISFPGFGIGEFTLDPVAFRIPFPWADEPHPVMWYGIIITLAMIVGFFIALRKSKFEKIKTDDVFDLAIYLMIFAIAGARLYYVLMTPEKYRSFYDVIAIWNGGLAIYGGIIVGAITIAVYSKIKKIKTAKILDLAVPGVIIGQAIGRWGNFFNAEAHGVATKLPWRMGIAQGYWTNRAAGEYAFGAMNYYHPTFLYESLWNILGFALIMTFYKKKKFDGQPTLWYLIWYGFGRFFIEGLRTDSLYLLESVLGKTVRVSQLVAAICAIGGVILLAVLSKKAKNRALNEGEYEEIYSRGQEDIPVGEDAEPSAEDAGDTASETAETEDSLSSEE